MQTRRKSTNPVRFHLIVAMLVAVAFASAFWWYIWPKPELLPVLLAWLVAVNIVAFGYYGFDKWKAGRGGRRVPELVLHTLAAIGGSIGAFIGMQLFRHKTVKGRFRFVFWAIVLLQLGLIGVIWFEYGN